MNGATLLIATWTLLVAVLAVAFTLRQIQRSDRWHREDEERRELEQIIEHHRAKSPSDLTTNIATGVDPVPDEWIRDWRERTRAARR